MNATNNQSKRRLVIVCIILLIAAIHVFPVEKFLSRELSDFYTGYFSDFILPFGAYLLLFLSEQELPFLRGWKTKLAIAFLIPAIDETFQYFGIPILGSTFDPLDYIMYASGAILAAIFDIQIFTRLFDFWKTE